MQEIGVWVTDAGTVEATLETVSDGVDEWSLPSWASGALQGAAAGALTGAAAGPYGALIGAAAGGALGAASAATAPPPAPPSAGTPAPKPDAAKPGAVKPTAKPGGDAGRAQAVQALQQFAAAVPVLVQLIAGGSGGKEVDTGDGGLSESFEAAEEWGPESFQGTWTEP
jgi:hypothetical protein